MGELFQAMVAQLAQDLENDQPKTAIGRFLKVLKTCIKIGIMLVIGVLFLPWVLALLPMVAHISDAHYDSASPLTRLYWLTNPFGLFLLYCLWLLVQLPFAAVRYVFSGSAEIDTMPLDGPRTSPFAKFGVLAALMTANLTSCVMMANPS